MITAKCIQKFRDRQNRIYGYRLQDTQGNIKDIKSDPLKQAIVDKQIKVINLTLTADNRLVDTQPTVTKQPAISNMTLEQKVQVAISKGATLGFSTPEVLYKLACQAGFKDIIELSDTDCEGDGAKLNTHFKNYEDALQHPEATIFITNMSWMFHGCQARTLDLRGFNTSNVTTMVGMFRDCKAQTIDLSSFNTSKVTTMSYMFDSCQAQTLNLSSFDTSNVRKMDNMFENCQAQTLDLRSFNTSKVLTMGEMFYDCKAQTIDLSSFNTSRVADINLMFGKCKAQIKTTDTRLKQVI